MTERVSFYDYHPEPADMLAEVLAGLVAPTKTIPPKFFYDQTGSRLFDTITQLPEYYPTRTEIGILRDNGSAMAELVGRGALLIELGSGSSLKIHVLLEALVPSVYIPVDISKDHLVESATALAQTFPWLEIRAVCADYSVPFNLPLLAEDIGRVVFFPGSSIGNFHPPDARQFLQRIGHLLGEGGRLLIGVDLRKDERILHAAYNDVRGVTAEFNKNLLRRINRELGADFDPDCYRHDAFFNPDLDRIEMHLTSTRDQTVRVGHHEFIFAKGEGIHTECSYKYRLQDFRDLAAAAGFTSEQVWTDIRELYSVHCLRFVRAHGDAPPTNQAI